MNLFNTKTGKREQDPKLNNGGYTLVELLVVMAVMVIMVGGMAMSASLMFSRDAKSIAVTIDDELAEARMLSMSKADDYIITIHTESGYTLDNKIIIDDGDSSTTPIEIPLRKKVSITVSQENGNDSYSSSGGEDIDIKFNKSNGGLEYFADPSITPSGVYVFTVESENGKQAKVTLVATTGRHYTEK